MMFAWRRSGGHRAENLGMKSLSDWECSTPGCWCPAKHQGFVRPLVLLGQFIKVGPGKAGGIRRAGPKTRSAHDRSQVSKLGAMIAQSSYRVFVRFGKRKQAPWGKKAPAVAGASHL